MIFLGIDPGLAHLGWACVQLLPAKSGELMPTMNLVGMGVIETTKWKRPKAPRQKKGQPKVKLPKVIKPSASEDNVRRAHEVGAFLSEVVRKPYAVGGGVDRVGALAIEAMSYPRNASAASKLMMSWGVLSEVVRTLNLPMVQMSPQKMKSVLTGTIKAEKEDVERAVRALFTEEAFVACGADKITKTRKEHAFDALGAAVVGALDKGSSLLGAVALPEATG